MIARPLFTAIGFDRRCFGVAALPSMPKNPDETQITVSMDDTGLPEQLATQALASVAYSVSMRTAPVAEALKWDGAVRLQDAAPGIERALKLFALSPRAMWLVSVREFSVPKKELALITSSEHDNRRIFTVAIALKHSRQLTAWSFGSPAEGAKGAVGHIRAAWKLSGDTAVTLRADLWPAPEWEAVQ